MRIRIEVSFAAEVPDGTDLDDIYINVPGQSLNVMRMIGNRETVIGTTGDYETMNIVEDDEEA